MNDLVECLACGGQDLVEFLDLGEQPLANELLALDANQSHERFPLKLNYCKNCFHSQLSVAINPERLFRNYLYVSDTTKTLQQYFLWFADEVVSRIGNNLRVLELASNDGSFLEVLKLRGHNALGVDPALNLLPRSVSRGVVTVCDFWPGEISEFITGSCDLVVAMNVIAHVSNPSAFLKSAAKALSTSGKILLQTSQSEMIRLNQFDTAYHEHLSFFNVSSMQALASRSGLFLSDVTMTPIHGSSYVWTLTKFPTDVGVGLSLRQDFENDVGLRNQETYLQFGSRSQDLVKRVRNELSKFSLEEYEIWGYGAAAKGSTFLNFARVQVRGFFDDNPLKQGLTASLGGVAVPIFHPTKMTEISKPICFLIPAWNFVGEIARRISSIRQNERDVIITYYPSLRTESVKIAADRNP